MAMDSKVDEHDTAEPMPVISAKSETILFALLKDMILRQEEGFKKYGTLLKTNNGRSTLVDAYQEAMDLTIYLKQTLMEQNNGLKQNVHINFRRFHNTGITKEWEICVSMNGSFQTKVFKLDANGLDFTKDLEFDHE